MPQVQVIPPIGKQIKKLRVAAYARVSSDSEEQLHSFATQVAYYTALIGEKEDWEFAGLYADEGVTGTSTAKREDFQRLLADCRAGKIDRILVKSISRFARNTTDCIQTVRELRTLGVSVYFEKEDIDTGAMGSEMLLSILGSAAQEESLSISQNLKWSYRRRMRAGEFITCRAPLGYYLKGNTLEPDPQEVPIVHYIFRSYLAGKGTVEIAEELNRLDSSPRQRWSTSAILYILRNEKYIGDSLVQKKFTPDTFPLRQQFNRGQVSQYYIHNSHPAILSTAAFEAVQNLLRQKHKTHAPKKPIESYPLSHIVSCGTCGSPFYRRPYPTGTKWLCSSHLKNHCSCSQTAVFQEEIFQSFLTLFNKLQNNREFLLRPTAAQLRELRERAVCSQPGVAELQNKIAELVKQDHALTRLQSKGAVDPALFRERHNRIARQLEETREKLRPLQQPDEVSTALEETERLLTLLESGPPVLEFDSAIFQQVVANIVVFPEKFAFHLKCGLALEEGRALS